MDANAQSMCGYVFQQVFPIFICSGFKAAVPDPPCLVCFHCRVDKPVAIFELIGRPPPAATVEDRVRRFEQALQLYRQGRFDPAAELFCALATEGDAPSEVFAERCRDLAASPPYDWDGVYVMDTK